VYFWRLVVPDPSNIETASNTWILSAHILIMTTSGIEHIIKLPALIISMKGIAK
jgi:hypothetical protein